MDYIGMLDASNSTDYQFIYSSQLYGTFFCVYAHFNPDPTHPLPSCQSGLLPVGKINFRIVNYKGLVNLGIKHVNHVPLLAERGFEIKLTLKAMDGLIDYTYDFNDCLEPGNDSIVVSREIEYFTAPGTQANNIALQDLNQVFDTEKWERNGMLLPIERNDTFERQPRIKAPGRSCLDAKFLIK